MTFLLPSGRFRYLHAHMGLSWSSDEFSRRSDEVVEGLAGVRKLVDDILIQAPDLETLNHKHFSRRTSHFNGWRIIRMHSTISKTMYSKHYALTTSTQKGQPISSQMHPDCMAWALHSYKHRSDSMRIKNTLTC